MSWGCRENIEKGDPAIVLKDEFTGDLAIDNFAKNCAHKGIITAIHWWARLGLVLVFWTIDVLFKVYWSYGMKRIPDNVWAQVSGAIKKSCERISEQELNECEQRIDLLVAKIQNRHWVSRTKAEELAVMVVKDAEAAASL